MDSYYNNRNRSRTPPPSRDRNKSSSNRIDLPEFIPLVTQQHSDHRSKNGWDHQRGEGSRERFPNNNESTRPPKRRFPSPPPPKLQLPMEGSSTRRRRSNDGRRSRSPQHSPLRTNEYSQSNRSRTNSSERNRSTVFKRLGNNHSPIRFDDQYRKSVDLEPVRIVVRNDNYNHQSVTTDGFNCNRQVIANDVQAEIIYSIRHLQEKNRDNMRHIQGVRMTVENYQREIYKLEKIVLETNQEIENLKLKLNSCL